MAPAGERSLPSGGHTGFTKSDRNHETYQQKSTCCRRRTAVIASGILPNKPEYALLRLFVVHAGKVLTHGQILREVWHTDDMAKTGHLRVYVAYLREKIEANPSEPELLVTEPGVGYRLAVEEED